MAKKSLEEKIEVTKNVLKENLNTVRAGRANPALPECAERSGYK